MSKPFKLTKKEVKTQIDLDGEIIDVVIKPLEIANRFMDIYTHLLEVQRQVSYVQVDLRKAAVEGIDIEMSPEFIKRKNEALENYGRTILELMTVTFGEETTTKLIEFYNEDYTNMLGEVLPFIHSEVLPSIQTYTDNLKRLSRKAFLKGGGKIGSLDAGK